MPLDVKPSMPLSGNDIIIEYFKCIDNKDVDGALELFDYDAVVHEPFSNVGDGLRGRRAIEPFIRVAMMASSNFKRIIEIEKETGKKNKIIALVTFEKGDKTKGKFIFEFIGNSSSQKKIKSLHIKF